MPVRCSTVTRRGCQFNWNLDIETGGVNRPAIVQIAVLVYFPHSHISGFVSNKFKLQ